MGRNPSIQPTLSLPASARRGESVPTGGPHVPVATSGPRGASFVTDRWTRVASSSLQRPCLAMAGSRRRLGGSLPNLGPPCSYIECCDPRSTTPSTFGTLTVQLHRSQKESSKRREPPRVGFGLPSIGSPGLGPWAS